MQLPGKVFDSAKLLTGFRFTGEQRFRKDNTFVQEIKGP